MLKAIKKPNPSWRVKIPLGRTVLQGPLMIGFHNPRIQFPAIPLRPPLTNWKLPKTSARR